MMNILLLAVLFVAGLVNFLVYFPTKRFSAWLKQSPTKSAAVAVAVAPPQPPTELRKIFRTFDKNNDGYITRKELTESLRNWIAEREAEELFEGVDENGDGLIDFEEFCVLAEKLRKEKEEEEEDDDEELREAFGVFDKDKDGVISVEELGLVLSCLGLKEGKMAENCREMIRKVDLDGDGMVNFEEFKRMMRNGGTGTSIFPKS